MQQDKPKSAVKRYATAAIIIGGGAVIGSSALMSNYPKNYGVPITHNGQQYYIPNDSKRVRYPSREACMQDVPAHMQHQCEPVSSYRGGGGGWYGPVYSSRDTDYRPSGQYPTEKADGSNVGKQLPQGANTTGFGSNGKALTGSKGG
ncbi:MAG TPA: hypothetical protein VD735_04775 [Candidatus Saccharimonadales bacterium]|nr:hypothetical protein [Candidatus Saccharimonadales bacterium]